MHIEVNQPLWGLPAVTLHNTKDREALWVKMGDSCTAHYFSETLVGVDTSRAMAAVSLRWLREHLPAMEAEEAVEQLRAVATATGTLETHLDAIYAPVVTAAADGWNWAAHVTGTS